MMLPSLSSVVTKYLYGSDSAPNTFVNPNLIRPEIEVTALPPISSQEFMAGPGRFALASSFTIVSDFFDEVNGYDVAQLFIGQTGNEVRLTKEQWANVLGLGSYGLSIDHKDFDDGQDNFAERVFLWGNTSFQISDAEFVVTRTMNEDGTYTYTKAIDNFAVLPRQGTGENFDFVSSDGTTTQTQHVSQHAVDPSGIGRRVDIAFVDDVPRETFTEADYWENAAQFDDLGYGAFEYNLPRQLQLQSGTQQIFDSLFSDGITSAVEAEKLVVYGTNESDTFSGWTTPEGINLLQQYENAGPYSFLMPQFQLALNGLIYVAGGGEDVVNGTSVDDVLFGGQGADHLFGGSGDDFIFFDAEDMASGTVNGGAGRDAAWAIGPDAIDADMLAMAVEVLIGGSGADTITLSGAESLMAAGGGGADTFDITCGEGLDTRIVWGGGGADVFNFTGEWAQLGILVATVTGLTAANFASFTLDMLGLPADFAWDAIDAVILNPDAEDLFTQFATSPDWLTLWGTVAIEEGGAIDERPVFGTLYTPAVQGISTTLGTSLHMQVPEGPTTEEHWFRYGEGNEASLLDGAEVAASDIDDFLDAMGSPNATWDVDISGMFGEGDATGMLWYTPPRWNGGPDNWDAWFVAGGAFDGTSLEARGAPHATMPDDPANPVSDWLLAA